MSCFYCFSLCGEIVFIFIPAEHFIDAVAVAVVAIAAIVEPLKFVNDIRKGIKQNNIYDLDLIVNVNDCV